MPRARLGSDSSGARACRGPAWLPAAAYSTSLRPRGQPWLLMAYAYTIIEPILSTAGLEACRAPSDCQSL